MVCLLVVVVFLLFPFLFDRQNTAKVYRTSTTFLNLILKLLFSSIFFRNDLIACLYPCSLAGNGLLGRITDVSRTLPGRIESLQFEAPRTFRTLCRNFLYMRNLCALARGCAQRKEVIPPCCIHELPPNFPNFPNFSELPPNFLRT